MRSHTLLSEPPHLSAFSTADVQAEHVMPWTDSCRCTASKDSSGVVSTQTAGALHLHSARAYTHVGQARKTAGDTRRPFRSANAPARMRPQPLHHWHVPALTLPPSGSHVPPLSSRAAAACSTPWWCCAAAAVRVFGVHGSLTYSTCAYHSTV